MSQAQVDPQNRNSGPRASGLRAGAHLVPLIFGLWTLFVWGGRLRNLWLDPGGFAEASRWSLSGSIIFSILGLAVVAIWLLGRFSTVTESLAGVPVERLAIMALAGFTTVVWLIRGVDIALGDHPFGFIAVHVVLAVVSIGLGVAALRRSAVG